MNKRILLIGKNSRIIRSLGSLINKFDAVSHADIGFVDFDHYDFIYLFSWCATNNSKNIDILKLLPLNKTIFISSVAVLSNEVRKQWANYPRWKLECENLVLGGGGKVARIGIWGDEYLNKHYGFIPFTTNKHIVSLLNGDLIFKNSIVEVYSLTEAKVSDFRIQLSEFLYRLSRILPSTFLFQVLPMLATKILKLGSYGYTRDALCFFGNKALVGFGVLGQSFYKRCKTRSLIRVFVSPSPDLLLKENGFSYTRIGKFLTGLSKFWHGVYVDIKSDGSASKVVPLFNYKLSLPLSSIRSDVILLAEEGNHITLSFDSSIVHSCNGKFNFVNLAAGPIINSKLIQRFNQVSCCFSDHEIGMIGTVSLDELVKMKLFNKIGMVGYSRSVLIFSGNNFSFMIDFRPSNYVKHSHGCDSIYNNSTMGILKKIISRLSFFQINEAFFNKFGFAFTTKNMSVFAQIEVVDAIKMDPQGSLKRERITKRQLDDVISFISKRLDTFCVSDSISLTDGQHILGGGELLDSENLKRLLNSGRLNIIGSPCKLKLGAIHHTRRFINGNFIYG